jgi:hypothetical protein
MKAFSPYILAALCIFIAVDLSAQAIPIAAIDSSGCTPPKKRELFHDLIDKEQKSIGPSRGMTEVMAASVDLFQCAMERDTLLGEQDKVRYLRGMESVLKAFNAKKNAPAAMLDNIITAYINCTTKDMQRNSIVPAIHGLDYMETDLLLLATRRTFEKNPGLPQCEELLKLKYCIAYPAQTFYVLKENPDLPFADSLVRIVSKQFPRQLYDYAASGSKLGALLHNIQDDPFIKTIVQMSDSRNGQQYFPFLDNLVRGKMRFADIDSVKDDSMAYYRLLVQTQLDYSQRADKGDTAYESKALAERLEKKALESFVNTINALHEEKPEVRFKSIQSMTAKELYYLIVSSDGIIYTSSFVKGVYPLMMQKCNHRGDSLLARVYYDKYRKLIKMSAGYNMLSDFLGSFPGKTNGESDAVKLMRTFVTGLENGNGLEDGVDVADSYASVIESMKPVAKEMLKNVEANYKRNEAAGNARGMALYRILDKIFLSADSSNKVDLVSELGISPVYRVPYEALLSDSGRVNVQVFFYSDIKVQGIFNGFIGLFNNSNWKIDRSNPQWVVIHSIKGKPVSIYANTAPVEENGEDEVNQKTLNAWLRSQHIYPSITIHRGHSYTAPYTIRQMSADSKIVFLGSCGGYQIINAVLQKIPDAHIIATKQIADAEVNQPFFRLLTEEIREGHNIEWIPFWKELDRRVNASIFEDYMPPYKNLGAIFIQAYSKNFSE